MFDNVAFNVVLGLVLIYLLYSLLVTIVSEILSTWMGIRARLLRVAIERMLNDGFYYKSGKQYGKNMSWWDRFVLKTPPGFMQSFAGKFYEYPSIKYLAKIESDRKKLFDHTKPSYISAENFADSLINLLSSKGAGNDKIKQISFCLQYNTLLVEEETLRHLRDILNNSGGDLELFRQRLMKWFNETMDRTNGWYKSKIKLVSFWFGFIVAVAYNVDSIKIASILSNDKEARNQLVKIGVELAKDSAGVYREFLKENGDSARPQTVLDSGLARINQDISNANLVLGLGWNFDTLRTSETIKIERKKDTALFDQLAIDLQKRDALQKKIDSARKALRQNAAEFLRLQHEVKTLMGDTTLILYRIAAAQTDTSFKAPILQQDLVKQTALLQATIKQAAAQKARIAGDSLYIILSNAQLSQDRSQLDFPGKNSLTTIKDHKIVNKDLIEIKGERPFTGGEKFGYWWYRFLLGLIGFIMTALALSLGAPFWFGLLNKLVSLRQAGVKPEEKSKEEQVPAEMKPTTNIILRNIPTAAEKPVETALRIYGDQIRREPGVVSVVKGYFMPADRVEECVQANVMNDDTAIELRRKYGNLRIGMNQFVFLNVLVTGKPNLNGGFNDGKGIKEKGICNLKTPDNIGSFGCLVSKNSEPGKTFLLTCYHVLNADNIWANRSVNQEIINIAGNIANSYRGFLTSAMDIAIADVQSDNVIGFYKNMVTQMGLKNVPKPVTLDNVFKTRVTVRGFHSTLATGIIVDNSRPETFEYALGKRRFRKQQIDDLIVINHTIAGSKPTDVGDSGAVVLDHENHALGIVVGSDFHHTYAIKINTIFDLIGLKLITS